MNLTSIVKEMINEGEDDNSLAKGQSSDCKVIPNSLKVFIKGNDDNNSKEISVRYELEIESDHILYKGMGKEKTTGTDYYKTRKHKPVNLDYNTFKVALNFFIKKDNNRNNEGDIIQRTIPDVNKDNAFIYCNCPHFLFYYGKADDNVLSAEDKNKINHDFITYSNGIINKGNKKVPKNPKKHKGICKHIVSSILYLLGTENEEGNIYLTDENKNLLPIFNSHINIELPEYANPQTRRQYYKDKRLFRVKREDLDLRGSLDRFLNLSKENTAHLKNLRDTLDKPKSSEDIRKLIDVDLITKYTNKEFEKYKEEDLKKLSNKEKEDIRNRKLLNFTNEEWNNIKNEQIKKLKQDGKLLSRNKKELRNAIVSVRVAKQNLQNQQKKKAKEFLANHENPPRDRDDSNIKVLEDMKKHLYNLKQDYEWYNSAINSKDKKYNFRKQEFENKKEELAKKIENCRNNIKELEKKDEEAKQARKKIIKLGYKNDLQELKLNVNGQKRIIDSLNTNLASKNKELKQKLNSLKSVRNEKEGYSRHWKQVKYPKEEYIQDLKKQGFEKIEHLKKKILDILEDVKSDLKDFTDYQMYKLDIEEELKEKDKKFEERIKEFESLAKQIKEELDIHKKIKTNKVDAKKERKLKYLKGRRKKPLEILNNMNSYSEVIQSVDEETGEEEEKTITTLTDEEKKDIIDNYIGEKDKITYLSRNDNDIKRYALKHGKDIKDIKRGINDFLFIRDVFTDKLSQTIKTIYGKNNKEVINKNKEKNKKTYGSDLFDLNLLKTICHIKPKDSNELKHMKKELIDFINTYIYRCSLQYTKKLDKKKETSIQSIDNKNKYLVFYIRDKIDEIYKEFYRNKKNKQSTKK